MVERIIDYISIFLAFIVIFSVRDYFKALVAFKCGDITPKINNRLTLNPLNHVDPLGLIFMVLFRFGWTKYLPINPNNFKRVKLDRFIVVLTGILVSYVLSFCAYPLFILAYSYLPQFGYFTTVINLTLSYIYSASLYFLVFNLLPVYPLSGFEIIDIFNKKRGKIYRAIRVYGIYVLYFLFLLSILSELLNVWWLDVLGVFIQQVSYYIAIPINLFWGLIF